jgi:hypothetical protein
MLLVTLGAPRRNATQPVVISTAPIEKQLDDCKE